MYAWEAFRGMVGYLLSYLIKMKHMVWTISLSLILIGLLQNFFHLFPLSNLEIYHVNWSENKCQKKNVKYLFCKDRLKHC